MRVHLKRAVFVLLTIFILAFLAVSVLQNKDITTLERSPPSHANSGFFMPRKKRPRRTKESARTAHTNLHHAITRYPDKFGPVIGRNGTYPWLWPHPGRWPVGANFDRIATQMKFVPRGYKPDDIPKDKYKTIYLVDGDNLPMGQDKFVKDRCPVNTCLLVNSASPSPDALLFKTGIYQSLRHKPANQTWILFALESPLNTGQFDIDKNKVNWTATYRPDSTIVAPYEKFHLFANATKLPLTAPRNFAAGKRKLVAWFVSNCDTTNGRMQYMKELKKYIEVDDMILRDGLSIMAWVHMAWTQCINSEPERSRVDMFGSCGTMDCTRDNEQECFNLLKKDYKFYLAFENTNCHHYITEKFFRNALMNDVLPIAMGARRQDYAIVAPPHSYIHVEDFSSPEQLAKYLHRLDADDTLYNDYFRWKGLGEFIDTKFWCRVCAMLHGDSEQWYPDVNRWWNHNGTCTQGRWDNASDALTLNRLTW